jgi:hypothetical protein
MALTWWNTTPGPTIWCGDNYDGRPRPRPKPTQWRRILTACIMIQLNDHYFAIKGKYDDNPAEMGWGLLGIALVLWSLPSPPAASAPVSKTAYMAEGEYTFEVTDTYGDDICCQYGAGRFKAADNGEPVASSSSGEFRESFAVVRRSTSPPSTIDWMSRTMTTRMGRVGRYRVSRPVLSKPRPAFTK